MAFFAEFYNSIESESGDNVISPQIVHCSIRMELMHESTFGKIIGWPDLKAKVLGFRIIEKSDL